MVMFRKVPDNSPLNPYEPYTVVDMTYQGFVYKSQITGQVHEVLAPSLLGYEEI